MFLIRFRITLFDKVSEYPKCVVLANDGSIHPGDIIALTAAQQLQFALKSQSGTTADHHLGHSH